ncbi:transcription factor HES-1-like isoform X2 [Triplophysa rosa]|uniref:transcription factor HES-1-like isoform X2 n=1 Tax=Triplophysa rosa TaxID=992332 RepID=UPI0025460D20|nr:transcription factor HES-1-like isoform X2 [Triplophysa rosa]
MTSHHITCKLSGHEQRCALDMTRNTTSENHSRDLQHRKSSKPIMEKRRRARINDSLTQLKSLILDALNKETSKHSKLDKADILEITVKHLKNLQRAQMTGYRGKERANERTKDGGEKMTRNSNEADADVNKFMARWTGLWGVVRCGEKREWY